MQLATWLLGLSWLNVFAAGGNVTQLIPHEMHAELIDAIRLIYTQTHLACDCSLYVFIGFEREANRFLLNDLITQLLQRGVAPHFVYQQRRHRYIPHPHIQIMIVDTWPALKNIFIEKKTTRNYSFTLIYYSEINTKEHPDIDKTLWLLWKLSILNVGILLRLASTSELVMISYFPFTPDGCQQIIGTVVNRYDSRRGQWLTTDYFPKKAQNFYGCQLTCAVLEDIPHFFVEKHGSEVTLKGFEGLMLQFIASKLNFTIDLFNLDSRQIKKGQYNHTGKILENIFSLKADFALGGFHYKSRLWGTPQLFTQSKFYYISSIMLVTKLNRGYTTYEKLAFPFHAYVWLAIAAIYVLGWLVVYLSQRQRWRAFVLGPRNSCPHYNMFQLTMGGNLNVRALPRRNFARYLLCTWMLVTLVLRCAYQSGLYRMMRDNSQRNPPQTISDVVNLNFRIALTTENLQFLNSLPEVREEQVYNMNGTELQALAFVAKSTLPGARSVAIVSAFEYFGYFRQQSPALSKGLHLVRERIFTQPLTFYIRLNSYIVHELNRVIQQAQTHGFINFWTDKYVGTMEDDSLDKYEDDQIDSNGRPIIELSMREMESIFVILLWIELIAFIIFCSECLIKRYMT